MTEKGTEQATPQKKKKAKEKGDFAQSRELLSAMAMLGGVATLGAAARGFAAGWKQLFVECLQVAANGIRNDGHVWRGAARVAIVPVLLPVILVLVASLAGALISGIMQSGGINVHASAIEPKFNKLNPASNLGNLFSARSLVRLLKSMVPAAALVLLAWKAIKSLMFPIPVMSMVRVPATFSTAYSLSLDAAWVTLAWSALDYAVERRNWNQRLKMSKQEVREEVRESMGDPHIKAKVRQIQHAMRKRKVKADMSRASVVITNPTHYAVALEFSFETMAAPTVLAKGRDLLAAEIREEAKWAGVPLIENPPLARSLYRLVEPGQSIPFELYAAVAGILAYLYRQKVEERVRKEREERERTLRKAMSESAAAVVGMQGFGGGM